jgi:hypothetical protein
MESAVQRTPYDVWLNISRFIDREVLITLSGVNRSFYDIATAARYEVIEFSKFDRYTKWLCHKLEYVPRTTFRPALADHYIQQ